MVFSKIRSFIQQEWKLLNLLRSNSQEEKVSEYKLSDNLIREVLAHNFSILLILSTAIATFGLISNSTATIIGAMIIAPLMIPIISFAYALVILDFRLLGYSFGRLIFGIILAIFIAFLTTEIIGFRIPGSEILSRTEPTLLDLGVAISAGTAGAFAKVRRSVSDAIPGVAISVALVPPLCVVGIGFALSDFSLSTGSFVLFLTNLVAIILTAALVFILESYGNWKKAIWGLLLLLASLFLITLPLNFNFREMIAKNQIHHALLLYIPESDHHLLESIQVEIKGKELFVSVEVVASTGKVDRVRAKQNLKKAQTFLSQQVGKPVHLKVIVFPIEIEEYEVAAPNS
ncbi:TIGR00341 family protein [Crocosphaera sp.]|uniref:TIGR00341 family protein n=1 Tax=Crocosphaera sp. TaxID=2729996 RepID=UPI003F25B8E4